VLFHPVLTVPVHERLSEILILVVVSKRLQPPAAAIEYVTVYVPGVLVEGVIVPVPGSIVSPAGALNVPPVVPVSVTDCGDALAHHGDPVYEIVADGDALIVTAVVVVTIPQPPAAAIVYVTIYVPILLDEGVMSPVKLFMVNPAGAENIPPVLPVKVTL
jgi:hypothetical protein